MDTQPSVHATPDPNTNGSQFFVCFGPTPHLDGKHCVFGEVCGGMDVLDRVENTPTGWFGNAPSEDVRVVDCGVGEGDVEEGGVAVEEKDTLLDDAKGKGRQNLESTSGGREPTLWEWLCCRKRRNGSTPVCAGEALGRPVD